MDYPDNDDLKASNVSQDDGISLAKIADSAASVAALKPLYDELLAAINEGDVTEDQSVLLQLALSMSNQMRAKKVFLATGTANDIVLTTPAGKQPVKALQEHDEIHFTVALTNTSTVQVAVDGLGQIGVANIVSANQLFKGALATISYLNGQLWLTKQINPLTGSDVKDMAKVITDSLDIIEVGEIALDGATLKRAEHPVYWAKVQATSNLIDQATKDADTEMYAGFYGTGDGETTFTIPTLGGEFIRGYDNDRGVDVKKSFGRWQKASVSAMDPSLSSINLSSLINSNDDVGKMLSRAGYDEINYNNYLGVKKSHYNSGTGVGALNANGFFAGGARPRNIAYFFKTRI
ncbi:hypothetical protein [Marinomonas transparens]|uniref:Uncharacterized protein n=1 Tax=Marinomonas transparens TaxID=2795388 RepID=A0A934N2V2_9GAMM|nr:hypothetical protein [Marinomonas transparens]MBJ7539077.1 hypothetical protein [Marinomonas transparens]